MAGTNDPIMGMGPTPATPWTWPHPTLPNRWNATVTEVRDIASEGRRVAVIEGALWPVEGSRISVHEDDDHLRAGVVARVELVLGFRQPAKVVIWADLDRQPADG